MALQSIPPLPWPPTTYAVSSGFGGWNTMNTFGMRSASVFAVPKSGTIAKVGFSLGTVTTTGTLRVGLYTVNSSGDPTATTYGGSAYATQSSLAANVYYELTLPTPASATLGDPVALVVEWDSSGATGNVRLGIASYLTDVPYSDFYNGTSWNRGDNATLCSSLGYSDGSYGYTLSTPIAAGFSGNSYGSTSTPNEYALAFTVPFAARASGAWTSFTSNNSGATTDQLRLYQGAGVLASGPLNTSAASNSRNFRAAWFPTPAILQPGVTYYASVTPTSTAQATVRALVLTQANMVQAFGWPVGCGQATRSGGAWSSVNTTTIPMVGVILDQLDDGRRYRGRRGS